MPVAQCGDVEYIGNGPIKINGMWVALSDTVRTKCKDYVECPYSQLAI